MCSQCFYRRLLLPPVKTVLCRPIGTDPNGIRSEWLLSFRPLLFFSVTSDFLLQFRSKMSFFISTTNENPRSLGKEIIETVYRAISFVNNCLLLDASFKLTGREAKLKTWWTEGRTVNSRAFPSRRYLKIEVEEKRKIFPFFFFFFFFDEFTPAMIMDWPQGFNDRAIPIRGYTNDCRTMTMSRKWDVMYTRRGKKNFQRCSKGPIVFKSYF